jgi:hypothetical protein
MRIKVPDRNTDLVGGVCTQCNNDFGNDLTLTTTWIDDVTFICN